MEFAAILAVKHYVGGRQNTMSAKCDESAL